MKKKILVLTNELSYVNGRATTGYELCKHLEGEYDLTILTFTNAQNSAIRGTVLPILPPEKRDIPAYCLKSLIQPHVSEIDMILCNMEEFLPVAVVLKYRLRCPALLIGQGTYIYYPFVTSRKRFLARALLRRIDVLIVPSRFTCEKVREFFDGQIEIITWGADPERFFPVPDVPKEPAFVFVGELKERKGVRYLLHAFERLRQEIPDLKLYMIGGHNTYQGAIKDSDVSDNVIFTGEIRDTQVLNSYYTRCLAHVLPSVNTGDSFEGFGIVHLEANACGLPSIGSPGCGNEDAIVDGVTGFLCPQRDVDYLYEKMKALATDPTLRENMGRQALTYAQSHTWEVAGRKLVNILERF